MKHLLFKLQSFLVLLVFTAASAYAQKSPVDMNRFIDDLMKKMTLEEKIGQLNLPVTGEITTGQAKSSNVAKRIRAGEVGGLFNLKAWNVSAMYRSRRLKKVVWVFLSYLVWMLFMDMKRCFPFLWDCRVHGI